MPGRRAAGRKRPPRRTGARPSLAPAHIALVFDFDGTLMPDSTSLFLRSRGIKDKPFWKRADARMRDGWDQVLAWLDLFLEEVSPGRSLAGLREKDLTAFGKSLDGVLFPGVRELFGRVRQLVAPFGVEVQFYIVSGGLGPIIRACPTVADHVRWVYASELDTDDHGVLRGVKRAVTFTEKTRYLFEIHKGLDGSRTERNPLLVNEYVDPRRRPVPFAHMIYVGDGATDIPCFSLLEANGGFAFGVIDRSRETAARRKVLQLLAPRPARVRSVHAPNYEPGTSLYEALALSLTSVAGRIEALREAAYGARPVRSP